MKKSKERYDILLGVIGHLVYERDKDERLLTKNEKNQQWIEEFYNKKIRILDEMLEEVKPQ